MDEAGLRHDLKRLLKERSLIRGDFVLASGRRSALYVDARRTTMSGAGLAVIGDLGLARLSARGWHPRTVGGLTMGADPVACAIALAAERHGMAIDAFTVRKQAKTHGTSRRIEGGFAAGAEVVVVEDVITTGQSALSAIAAVREEGGTVLGVLAVVDREEGGRAALEAAGLAVETLVTVSDLL